MERKFAEEDQKRKAQLRKRKAIRRRRQRIRRLRLMIGCLLVTGCLLVAGILIGRRIFFTPDTFPTVFPKAVDVSAVVSPSWIESRLIEINPYSRPGTPLKRINGIVIHYVANPGTTAEQNNNYFAGLASQSGSDATKSSSHFLIGMDGTVIQNIPITEIAYCSNERNEDTISIECCHPDETGEFTEETYASLVELTAWLAKELRIKENGIIRHYDVTGKSCPKYFVDNEDAWLDFKKEVMETSKEES